MAPPQSKEVNRHSINGGKKKQEEITEQRTQESVYSAHVYKV